MKKIPCWVWDARHQYSELSEDFEIVHSIKELPYTKAILQPDSTDLETFDQFCKKALSWNNLVVVVEEAHLYSGKYKIKSKGFAEIVNAGRPLGISFIAITRRPQQIHNDILSDAEHIFCFDVELPTDVEYMTKWIGQEVQLFLAPEQRKIEGFGYGSQGRLAPHSFVYRNIKDGSTEIGRL